jgi:YbbR domain-containing protein
MGWLTRNWHLKLAALGLATVLYTGLVYSGSFTDQVFPGLPVEAINQPSGAYPLTQQLGTVDVNYRLAADAPERVTADSFVVTVDLSEYDMERSPEVQSLDVHVTSLQQGVEVLDYVPTTVAVALDQLGERQVRVEVETGDVPEGLAIGTPRTSHEAVTATGPESELGRVNHAVARVQIDPSGIDVRQPQVPLVPVDIDGREVESVDLEPANIQVEIDVLAVETSKTVPIRPVLTGNPANGFQVDTVTVEPAVVTIFGPPDTVEEVTEVTTQPLSVDGANGNLQLDATLVLPDGTRPAEDAAAPVVNVTVGASIATRSVLVGVICEGAPDGFACLPQQEQLSVTLRGPAAELADLDPADLTPTLDASGLDPGSHTLTPTFTLPNGIELVSVSPGSVTVQIVPPATPSPAAG